MVKLVNKKNPKVVIKVEDYLAGDYVSTKEWELYKEKPKEVPKENKK